MNSVPQEAVVWDAEPGWIVLYDDRKVWVERGDRLLVEFTGGGMARFVERLEGAA